MEMYTHTHTHTHTPDDNLTELAIVLLGGPHILTYLWTETEVRDALVFTVDLTESRHLLGSTKLCVDGRTCHHHEKQ